VEARRIGIMGGTFDPIHNGHLAIARGMADRLALDTTLFIPTGNPHFKLDKHVTDARVRAEMVALAIEGEPDFELDCCEVEREGVTYTADTLEELHERYPDAELFFIMGTDSAESLVHWRRAADVAALCKIVVARRPGSDLSRLMEAHQASRLRFDLTIVEVPQLDISSTMIRDRVAAGKPIDELVPAPVAAYIAEHNLYRP
jgi:nicotinate-nucleotide adenylyltransferase